MLQPSWLASCTPRAVFPTPVGPRSTTSVGRRSLVEDLCISYIEAFEVDITLVDGVLF